MGIYTGTAGKDRMLDGSITPGVKSVPENSPGPSEGNDILWGRESDDDLSGSGGDDELHGEDGNDTLNGEGSFAKPPVGNDKLYGDGGNDHLYGNDGNDELHGGADDDYLYGQEGNDNLYGEAGKDNLDGGSGRNVLNGGLGQDILQGNNAGTDFFDFDSLADSTADKSRDVIKDFQFEVDKIDFSDIGSFKFMGTTILSPTGPNQIILLNGDNAQTIIQLHTNTDGVPESEIAVDDRDIDASVYKESDFVLEKVSVSNPPKIGQVETFREGDLVFFRLSYTDPDNDAEGFGFRGVSGSGWAEETHPFSSPSYGRVSPGTVEYPFNHACTTASPYESDVEAWIYDSTGLVSAPVPIHLACSGPSEMDIIGGTT